MTGLRLGTAIAVVLGLLAVAVWALWPSGDGDDLAAPTSTTAPPTTAGTSTTSTTPSTSSTTSTTLPDTTTTTSADQRLAEVELILEELWFGWFDAIYREDEDALWQVVATSARHVSGTNAMESLDFIEAPSLDGTDVEVIEILLDRPDCLVTFSSIDVSAYRGPGASTTSVDVLWSDEQYGFRRATSWANPNDLWLSDCDDLEREQTP